MTKVLIVLFIALVLEAVSWNKLEAARVLDISRGTLYRKIDEYGLEPSATRRRREPVDA
jgi:DNA-binding NtrC family response regulator